MSPVSDGRGGGGGGGGGGGDGRGTSFDASTVGDDSSGFFLTGDGTADLENNNNDNASTILDASVNDDHSALDDLPIEFFMQSSEQHQQQHAAGAPTLSPRTLAGLKLDPTVTGRGGRSTQVLYTKQPVMGEQVSGVCVYTYACVRACARARACVWHATWYVVSPRAPC